MRQREDGIDPADNLGNGMDPANVLHLILLCGYILLYCSMSLHAYLFVTQW